MERRVKKKAKDEEADAEKDGKPVKVELAGIEDRVMRLTPYSSTFPMQL